MNSFAQIDGSMLKQPDVSETQITFVYAGDIWVVAADGGDAKRLTSHKGLELFPKFSPDGKWIAFSAEYSGTRQIYVMPASGGTPKQLTYYNDVGNMPPRGGWDYVVLDWTPDSRKIMVRANITIRVGRSHTIYITNTGNIYIGALMPFISIIALCDRVWSVWQCIIRNIHIIHHFISDKVVFPRSVPFTR